MSSFYNEIILRNFRYNKKTDLSFLFVTIFHLNIAIYRFSCVYECENFRIDVFVLISYDYTEKHDVCIFCCMNYTAESQVVYGSMLPHVEFWLKLHWAEWATEWLIMQTAVLAMLSQGWGMRETFSHMLHFYGLLPICLIRWWALDVTVKCVCTTEHPTTRKAQRPITAAASWIPMQTEWSSGGLFANITGICCLHIYRPRIGWIKCVAILHIYLLILRVQLNLFQIVFLLNLYCQQHNSIVSIYCMDIPHCAIFLYNDVTLNPDLFRQHDSIIDFIMFRYIYHHVFLLCVLLKCILFTFISYLYLLRHHHIIHGLDTLHHSHCITFRCPLCVHLTDYAIYKKAILYFKQGF